MKSQAAQILFILCSKYSTFMQIVSHCTMLCMRMSDEVAVERRWFGSGGKAHSHCYLEFY